MINGKLLKLIFTALGIIIASLIVYDSFNARQKGKRNFETFYRSRLNGRIESIMVSVGVVYFKLENDSTEYSFMPNTDDLNENKIFSQTARVGDFVIKESFSDTLTLIKSGKEYLYVFHKEK
jgi:hypothetical protein